MPQLKNFLVKQFLYMGFWIWKKIFYIFFLSPILCLTKIIYKKYLNGYSTIFFVLIACSFNFNIYWFESRKEHFKEIC